MALEGIRAYFGLGEPAPMLSFEELKEQVARSGPKYITSADIRRMSEENLSFNPRLSLGHSDCDSSQEAIDRVVHQNGVMTGEDLHKRIKDFLARKDR